MAILETKDQIDEAYRAADKFIQPYFEPLAEFERIARNKPHPNVIKAKLPRVTDGTLASVVQSQPRRIIQRLPTGRVHSPLAADLEPYVNYIWTNQILPHANTSGDPLQKWWITSTRAKTYGSQPIYSFFKNDGEYYGADFVPPYIKDVRPEPGCLNANDSEYMFLVSWWTKGHVQALIEREKKLKRKAKERSDQYDSKWNLSALAELLDGLEPKEQAAKSPAEDKDTAQGYVKIIHAFQRGIDENFFSYSPKLNKIVRTWTNPDPRGCLPIHYMYETLDLSNPLGRGTVELSGGMQNLLDSRVQTYQLTQTLMTSPPVMKWGNVKTASIKLKPSQVIDMGMDQNSKLEPWRIETQAIANFANDYGLIKSQILNLTNNQDTSVGASAGNPSFSKTPAGVNANQQRVGVEDNYFRKQFETAFEAVSETMLNLHFAESDGTQEIALTEEFLEQIQGDEPEAPDDKARRKGPITVDPAKKQATIAYSDIKTKFKFEVNPTSTKVPDDEDQVAKLHELLQDAGTNMRVMTYFLGQSGYDFKVGELYRDLYSRLGVENIDRIMVKMPPDQAKQAKQQPFPILDPPQIRLMGNIPNSDVGAALAQGGVNVDPKASTMQDTVDIGDIIKDPSTTVAEKAQIKQMVGITPDPNAVQVDPNAPAGPPPPDPNALTPDHILKADQQAHSQVMDQAKLALEVTKASQPQPSAGAPGQSQGPQGDVQQPQDNPTDPQSAPEQPGQLTPEDEHLVQQLLQAGFSQEQAMQGVQMLNAGYDEQQILQVLTQAQAPVGASHG